MHGCLCPVDGSRVCKPSIYFLLRMWYTRGGKTFLLIGFNWFYNFDIGARPERKKCIMGYVEKNWHSAQPGGDRRRTWVYPSRFHIWRSSVVWDVYFSLSSILFKCDSSQLTYSLKRKKKATSTFLKKPYRQLWWWLMMSHVKALSHPLQDWQFICGQLVWKLCTCLSDLIWT